ncbi:MULTISPECIES: VG15 protein [Streptomyces]
MPQETPQQRSRRQQSEKASLAFRLAQAKLGMAVAKAVAELFKGVSPLDLIDNAGEWANSYADIVVDYREQSRKLARKFYKDLRRIQGATTPMTWPPVDKLAERREAVSSFLVHGPLTVDREIKRHPNADLNDPKFIRDLDAIMTKAASKSASDAARLTENGGRHALHEAVASDKGAIGYYRQAQAGACAFCLMLASRGVVYKTRKSAQHGDYIGADGKPAYHRNCHCQPVPVFVRHIDGDEVTEKAKKLWKSGDIQIITSSTGKKYPVFKKGRS